MTIKILEGFAGIGAVSWALENLGISYKSDIIEWNIYSTIAYAASHHNAEYLKNKSKNTTLTKKELNKYLEENYSDNSSEPKPLFSLDGKVPIKKYNLKEDVARNLVSALQTVNNFVDISKTSIADKEKYDLFWHSSPCQNFSMAGNNKGGDKGSGTSSSLLYESIRLIIENKPQIVIWENVKGALSDKHIHNVEKYKDELTKLGYSHSLEVLTGLDVGWVQSRPRVFIYSYLDKKDKVDLSSILSKTYTKTNLNNVIDFTKDSLDMKFATSSVTRRNSKLAKENFISRGFNLNKDNYLFDAMLSPSRPAKAVVGKAPTLLTSKRFAKYSSITKKESLLTSQEYWDLMSFPKNKYQLVKPEILDNQIYKICGNSVLVCVIEEILKLNKNIK